jgi:hypothetical protein
VASSAQPLIAETTSSPRRFLSASTIYFLAFVTATMAIDDKTPKQSGEIVKIEDAGVSDADLYLQGYPLLREKTKDELDKLNKAVLKKLDWKFLLIITLMLLMK